MIGEQPLLETGASETGTSGGIPGGFGSDR